jgi:hypothetical protein
MSKRTLAVVAALALMCAGGLALARQQGERPPGGAQPLPIVPSIIPGQPGMPPATPGRYAAAVSGPSEVLVDTATGKSWVLHRGGDGSACVG